MGDLFLTGAISVGMLLLMAVPGFILGKMRSVNTESAVKFLSVMLLYILQPFVTFDSFLNTAYDPEVLINIVIVFVFTCVTIGAVLAVGSFAMRFTKFGKDVGGVIAYGGAFGNVGYMCIPFLQLMAPGDYVIILYATVSVVAFNLMAWTVGNFALTGYSGSYRAVFRYGRTVGNGVVGLKTSRYPLWRVVRGRQGLYCRGNKADFLSAVRSGVDCFDVAVHERGINQPEPDSYDGNALRPKRHNVFHAVRQRFGTCRKRSHRFDVAVHRNHSGNVTVLVGAMIAKRLRAVRKPHFSAHER